MRWPRLFGRPAPSSDAAPTTPYKIVATGEYMTRLTGSDGRLSGKSHAHVVTFMVAEDGTRFSIVESTDPTRFYVEGHTGLFIERLRWQHHGEIPAHACRVEDRSAELVVFPGGKGDAA